MNEPNKKIIACNLPYIFFFKKITNIEIKNLQIDQLYESYNTNYKNFTFKLYCSNFKNHKKKI